MEQKGTLYLCATPIGNLEDITLRALRVLREVDLIAAEDTRHTRKLLSRYDIHTPLTSYHEHNRQKKGGYLLDLLASGKQIALVTDAGMPGVSDPGTELVVSALKNNLKVVPVPGPSAGITALVVSGLPAGAFAFEGFLPAARKARRDKLAALSREPRTLIFYEAPHRLTATLADLQEVFGNRLMAAARELTKQHEEVVRGTVAEVLEHFRGKEPRGEFCLVLAGAAGELLETAEKTEVSLEPAEHVARLEAEGAGRKEAIRAVARAHGLPRREVYRAVVLKKQKSN
ncbi:16S rRNA (cytidine(1402)-2'-O)-methyltransferase [Pelotomaculum terephthalicicum JT]|uniref:16S rRNA (cytidine(1402)-2'-O)-methyltransferase n=1 Tax=Pelotomaculum TaxID=191373 RepID=UPI0009D1AC60|nr:MULTISPECIES: 16S rRNA (cytidine(1402)-2'-O)-methyltransferase [Pelotomaculum]MCG9968771.1 16S rRNA (cytidine(1402)-2'-O)-methyltransferase [Pelotomaculum terephthalicicum JT]OPX84628.1 MAG: Ribosomal RNA small subunit methyltransferase I [Pelotomaculum sp. PtaB.Bin117]OPY63329.1 MAG: Ribosomal RNA small subunit methyltransferase I [Pelotomaculum sp. PtaU1.Bin065]